MPLSTAASPVVASAGSIAPEAASLFASMTLPVAASDPRFAADAVSLDEPKGGATAIADDSDMGADTRFAGAANAAPGACGGRLSEAAPPTRAVATAAGESATVDVVDKRSEARRA